jgi:AcrR family transcriptional regulator
MEAAGARLPTDRSVGYSGGVNMRLRLLDEARRLTITGGSVPSLNALAAAANVSKGGLVHHFPTRAALVDGLARAAIAEVDHVMLAAAAAGTASVTWLQLASPKPAEADLFRALAAAYQSIEDDCTGTLTAAAEAAGRWEALIADEVGDALTARVIRLLGDGITFNTLVGVPVPVDDAAELVHRVSLLAQPRN